MSELSLMKYELIMRVEALEDELDELKNPEPDWFAPRETFEAAYARLHPLWPAQRGTNPAPWAWQNALS